MSDLERSRQERADRAEAHRAAAERTRTAESERAHALVLGFVADAQRAGLPTEELTVRPWRGRHRYRTGTPGWYLRTDRSLGVGLDGSYYRLIVPPRRWGRWRRHDLVASPPPLQVGEGAPDGESVALEALLRWRLGS